MWRSEAQETENLHSTHPPRVPHMDISAGLFTAIDILSRVYQMLQLSIHLMQLAPVGHEGVRADGDDTARSTSYEKTVENLGSDLILEESRVVILGDLGTAEQHITVNLTSLLAKPRSDTTDLRVSC